MPFNRSFLKSHISVVAILLSVLTASATLASCGNLIVMNTIGRNGLALTADGDLELLVNACSGSKELAFAHVLARLDNEPFDDHLQFNLIPTEGSTGPGKITATWPTDSTSSIVSSEWTTTDMPALRPDPEQLIIILGSGAGRHESTGDAEALLGQIWALKPDEVFVGTDRIITNRKDFWDCTVDTPFGNQEYINKYAKKRRPWHSRSLHVISTPSVLRSSSSLAPA